MKAETAQKIINKKFRGYDVKFIGSGSDSLAYRVKTPDGNLVLRFSDRDTAQFKKEAAVCDFIRPNITAEIPQITVVENDTAFYVMHKMLMGNKWSWHSFSFRPRRQRALADSLGKFIAELHGVNTAKLKRAVPMVGEHIPYTNFEDARAALSVFMGKRRLEFFGRHYNRIINAPVKPSDMTLVHLGIKGPNSVVDENGALCGVFDFCNCGIYERWREFPIMYLARNRKLYRQILRAYEQYTGLRPDRNRIIDLAAVEFMWEKRRKFAGKIIIAPTRFVKKNIAFALTRFNGLPRWCAPFIHMQLNIHQWWFTRRHK